MKPGERKQEKLDAYEQLFERYPFLSKRWFIEQLDTNHDTFYKWEKDGFPETTARAIRVILAQICDDLLNFEMPKSRIKER